MNIKRILVAIDASSYSLNALETAVNLAEKLQVDLHGIYIEDSNLLRLAQLPFAREYRFSREKSQKLDTSQMSEQLRLQATLARRHFNESVTKKNINHSFQTLQGTISGELEKAAQDTDILVMGRISRSLMQTSQLGSTAKTAVSDTHASLLLTHATFDPTKPILLIHDGSNSADNALILAITWGGENGRYNILINSPIDDQAQQIKNKIDAIFQNKQIKGSFRRLHHINLEEIQYALHITQSGMLIVNHNNKQLTKSAINDLLERVECPLLILK